MEWFKNIPKDGILCKCKSNKYSEQYKIDVITRYNEHQLSDYKFRNNVKHYQDAIPVSLTEVMNMIYLESLHE